MANRITGTPSTPTDPQENRERAEGALSPFSTPALRWLSLFFLVAPLSLFPLACERADVEELQGAEQPVQESATSQLGAGEVDSPSSLLTPPDGGPTTDMAPNELGDILVLEYHRLGEPEGEFVRKAENFRKDLERLYALGYRPITMRQMLAGEIDLPRGTSPVVFTIDDSSRGQFYFLEDGSTDPNSMVGIWERFQQANPAWKNGAVWCVLPAADHPSNFFAKKPSREIPREEREAEIHRKMDYLTSRGHEVCNHTLYHARLDRARDDSQVQEWIGRGEDSIQVYLPENYDIVTLALPLGVWPDNEPLAWSGEWNGRKYNYEAVLEVSGGPNPSPFSMSFNPHSINRFIVAPGALERQLDRWTEPGSRRYVSDGDPSVVSFPPASAPSLSNQRLGGKTAQELPG